MTAVLVVAPHAMDEVLGCGGTMALHAAAGDTVHTLALFGDGSGMDEQRRVAGPAAARALGSIAPRFTGFPENRSDTLPLLQIIGAIERAIAETAPAIVYVTHGGNLNIDHQTAFRAVLTAARPVPGYPVSEIYAYEVPSSTEWASASVASPFVPTRFVDITATIETKMMALDCYAAELRQPPHSRSRDGVRALATLRGHTMGLAAAEAFMVIRQLVRP